MKLREIYATRKPVFSFEFFPPKSDKGEVTLLEEAQKLKALTPSFFSMTYGAGGSTREKTVSLGARVQRETGVDVVCHVTCVGQSRDDVRGVLREIESHGLENVMALRGDPPQGQTDWQPHPDGFRHAYELVAEARRMEKFSIAVAGFPETHPEAVSREKDLAFLKAKVETGADAVVTQLFFNNEHYFRYVADLKALGVHVPIVPGIMPILSASQIRRISTLSSAEIPERLSRMLDEVGADDAAARELGIEYAAGQIRELLDRGAPGIHLYCLNKADSASKIFNALGLI